MAPLPWAPMLPVEREMHSLLRRLESLFGRSEERLGWRPSTDVFREDDELVITVELPGVAGDDVEISIENGVLHIRGERRDEFEEKRDDSLLSERFFGRFERSLSLPEGVDERRIDAEFGDGLLTVRIPMPEPRAGTSRRIPIRDRSGG